MPSSLFRLFLFALLFAVRPAFAQTDSISSATKHCASVALAGKTITCIENGVASFSAQDRADAANDRLKVLGRDLTFNLDHLTIEHRESSSDILAGQMILLTITDADAKSAKLSRSEFSESVLAATRSAIEHSREQHTPRTLLFGILYSLLATAVFLLLLLILGRVHDRVHRRIQNAHHTSIRTIKFQSFELLTAERIIATLQWVAQTVRLLLTLILLYFYVPLVFSFFPWTADLSSKIITYIVDPLKQIARVTVDFIPNLFFILVIAVVTRYVLKFIRFFFDEVGRGTLTLPGFYADWAAPTYKLVRVLVMAFALVMAFPYIPGSSSPAFQGISVFLGILLSLGSSSAISNMVAGIVLTYMRPFRVGNRVKIADTMGDVLEKTLLVTRVRTIKNVEVTIPNAMVLSSHIINYSAAAEERGLILHTTVTIGYESPWPQVHEALKDAAKRTQRLLSQPAPFILQTALNDSTVAYELNVFTKHPNQMAEIYSDLHRNIHDAFNEAGLELMSPHYLSVRDGNESTVPAENRHESDESRRFHVDFKSLDKPHGAD